MAFVVRKDGCELGSKPHIEEALEFAQCSMEAGPGAEVLRDSDSKLMARIGPRFEMSDMFDRRDHAGSPLELKSADTIGVGSC